MSLFRTKHIIKLLTIAGLITFMLFPSKSRASDDNTHEKKFNAGELIINHIIDSYEWHIATIGETHISLYLPVILFYEGELIMFSSKHLHHGHSSYKGFRVESEGMKKGKIVRVLEDGITTDPNASFLLDVSITKNVVGIFVTTILVLFVFLRVAKSYRKNTVGAPKGLQSAMEFILVFVRDEIIKPAIGEKHYMKFAPLLLTIFFLSFLQMSSAFVPFFPGGANVTGNIAVTATLAMFTFFTMLLTGNKNFYKHIYNTPGVPWYMKIPLPIMPTVEILGLFTKPFVLMIRLFANITAGHIVALGFISLIFIFSEMSVAVGIAVTPLSVFFYIFIGLLELLVAFIQAYVFTLLSALYFGMAVEEHHHEEHHHEEVHS
jgi:F-type H+-transporting ATPase subunit a